MAVTRDGIRCLGVVLAWQTTVAMARQGRYQQVADNLRVKEVEVSDTERFVVCHNPDAAATPPPAPGSSTAWKR